MFLQSVHIPRFGANENETSSQMRASASRTAKPGPAYLVFETEKTMTSWSARVFISIFFSGWLAVGCNLGPNGNATEYQPLLFPSEGQLGDTSVGTTVAMIVDSNYIEGRLEARGPTRRRIYGVCFRFKRLQTQSRGKSGRDSLPPSSSSTCPRPMRSTTLLRSR